MGIKKLRSIRLGREATAGTAVATTTYWRGLGTIQDDRTVILPDENIALLPKGNRAYVPVLGASIGFEPVEATFEQINHIFEAGIKTATPSADGGGTGYVYTYAFPTTAQNTLKTYTIEGGDDVQGEEMEYSYVERFGLSGQAGEAWMIDADWKGRQVTNATLTAGATLPTVEDMLFSKTKIYVDDSGGSIGTTQLTSTLLEASVEVDTGWRNILTADGSLVFNFIKCVEPTIEVKLTYEHNATAVLEKTDWRSETIRLLRLITEGSALGYAGSYTYKTLILDMAGYYTAFEKIGERDGNDIVVATLQGIYSSADTLFAQFLLVNELAAVP